MENKIALSVQNINKKYGNLQVLNNISLDVEENELLVLLGPSGCGKTTLLKIIAGLLDCNSGKLLLNNKDISSTPTYKRDIGLVFQNYALFPHMTVAKNVSYGLRMRNIQKEEITKRVKEALMLVQLNGMENRSIKALSGGQQQRVALARALVINPSLLLLDEPLSNLDAKLRAAVRVEITQIQKKLGITSILVTHDQTEAMTMGDRIVLMCNGEIIQNSTPTEIFDRPKNVFVASFIGSPQINLLNGKITENKIIFNEFPLELPLSELDKILASDINRGKIMDREVIVGIRPENFQSKISDNSIKIFDGKIEFIENLGSDYILHLKYFGKEIVIRSDSENGSCLVAGQEIPVYVKSKTAHLFDATTKNRII